MNSTKMIINEYKEYNMNELNIIRKSQYREQVLSNLQGLTKIDRNDIPTPQLPNIMHILILTFGHKKKVSKVLEYRTQSERDNKFNELKLLLKEVA